MLREAGLSWGFGAPQILHFVFIVERFLKQILNTGCNIRIIFFKDIRRSLYNLRLSQGQVGSAALLVRDVVIAHLKKIPSLDVEDTFENWWSNPWIKYLGTEFVRITI
jgi:hypothetical protein